MSGQGAAIGAATGATYALATGKDPVKYAMIGGAVGGAGPGAASALGIGGTAAGTTAAGTTAAGATQVAGTGSALTGAGASTAANTAFMAPAGVNSGALMGASQGAGYTSAAVPGTIFSGGLPATNTSMQGQGLAQTTAMQRPLSLGTPGVEASSLYEPTFMDRISQVGQFAQQNPQLTNQAMQSAQQAMQQPEARMAPAGQISRGQIQGGDFMSLLNPQQGSVIRQQPISLLG